MRNIILSLAAVAVLCGCSGAKYQLKPGKLPADGNAVFVARVELDPAINDDFEQAKEKDKNLMQFAIQTKKGDGTNTGPFDEDADDLFAELETNKFFAIEQPAGQDWAISGIRFSAYHKPYWLSNTEHFYYTTLSNPSWAVDGAKTSAGRAYYIGTIKIGLKEKSFADEGKGKYDHDEFQLAIPQSIALANESAQAQKWFDENHSKIGGKIETKMAAPKDSGEDNQFEHRQVTTTRY